jgi:hypothetical protein
MSLTKYPAGYLDANTQQSKPLIVVFKIEGLSYAFALNNLYTRVRYGDAGLTYGMVGLVYGSLRKLAETEAQSSQMVLENGLTIQQRLEPEQGKGSISTLSLVFADVDGLLTQLCAPGVILDDILGGKEVKVGLGYQNTNYPDDFFWVFRGTIGGYRIQGPRVTLQLVDPNQKSRQPVFVAGNAVLSTSIDNVVTTIPLTSVGSFAAHIAGPDGTFDTTVKTFIKIDDEWMMYGAGDVDPIANTLTVTRNLPPPGYNAVGAASHAAGSSVSGLLELGAELIGGNPITLALKVYLSGWAGPWKTGEACYGLGSTFDLAAPSRRCIALPANVDADEEYGIAIGDYITVSGSAIPGNNTQYQILGFQADSGGRPNRNVLVDQDLSYEYPSAALLAFRSQFDTLPTSSGARMKPSEIDVPTFVQLRNWFFTGAENNMQFTLDGETIAKDFVEKELILPLAAYSLTRYGRLSLGYTRPPVAADKLVTLSIDNVINPENIVVERATNTRRFYNYITYDFDFAPEKSIFLTSQQYYDADSYSLIKELSSLPIQSKGMRTALGSTTLAQNRAAALLQRYGKAAHEITIEVNWEAGSLVEVGDIVLVVDNGNLKIANLVTGARNIGEALYEVIDRTLNIKDDRVKLKLLGGIIDNRANRYGAVSPSSVVVSGDTNSVRVETSFAETFGVDEGKKWLDYPGLLIAVHSLDYVNYAEVELGELDPNDVNRLPFVTSLPFTPTAGMIVDVARFPASTDPEYQAKSKLINAYMSPSVPVVSAIDLQTFVVDAGDIGKFSAGRLVTVHNADFSHSSAEMTVESVIGNNVKLTTALTFSPDNTHRVEFIGFADASGAYRLL